MVISEIGNTTDSEFFGPDYVFMTDSQDIQGVTAHTSRALLEQDILPDDVTGVMALIQNADYGEVWVTESSRPFSASALFTRVR